MIVGKLFFGLVPRKDEFDAFRNEPIFWKQPTSKEFPHSPVFFVSTTHEFSSKFSIGRSQRAGQRWSGTYSFCRAPRRILFLVSARKERPNKTWKRYPCENRWKPLNTESKHWRLYIWRRLRAPFLWCWWHVSSNEQFLPRCSWDFFRFGFWRTDPISENEWLSRFQWTSIKDG